MAATVSRRLTSKVLKPFHSCALCSSSTYILLQKCHPINPNPCHFTPNFAQLPTAPQLPLQNAPNPSLNTSSFTKFKFQSSPYQKSISYNHHISIRSHTTRSSSPKFKSQPHLLEKNPQIHLYGNPKYFSTSNPSSDSENPQNPIQYPSQNHPEFKPPQLTVEKMIKIISTLRNAFALVGLVQLGLGAWIAFITQSSPIAEVSIQSLLACGFSLSMAFMLRQLLKSDLVSKLEKQVISEVNIVAEDMAWMIDSGATCHTCGDKSVFSAYSVVGEGDVHLFRGDSRAAHVIGKGNVNLKLTSGRILSLTDVLHVPENNANIISVSLLGKVGFQIIFESDKVVVTKNGVFFGQGYFDKGLFFLK